MSQWAIRVGAGRLRSGVAGDFVDRRGFLSALSLAGASILTATTGSEPAQSSPVDVHAILDDPDAPVGGNPDGDVTIVAYVDYNCPFCKRSEPDLQRLVSTDGQIRLIYKDWPILAKSSVTGARLALAAKYQGKYEAAHAALMTLHGRSSDAAMRDAVAAAGVDTAQLDRDLDAHNEAIMDLIRRNGAQADALQLKGTPVYLIGPYIVAAAGVDGARLDKDLAAHGEAIMDLIRRNAAQADALHVQGTPVHLIGPYIAAAALTYDEFADVVAKFRAQMGK